MNTEKKKMLLGEVYQALDSLLIAERERAREIIFELNNTFDRAKRREILLKLLGSAKGDFWIESIFHCDYGYNIHLGKNFYANVGCTILDAAEVSFGDNVLLAPHVGIYTAGHPLDSNRRVEGWEYASPVKVGNNVWIGANSVILPGVEIGDNSVIGAGSVVTKSIPARVLAVGNPCRVLREIE